MTLTNIIILNIVPIKENVIHTLRERLQFNDNCTRKEIASSKYQSARTSVL